MCDACCASCENPVSGFCNGEPLAKLPPRSVGVFFVIADVGVDGFLIAQVEAGCGVNEVEGECVELADYLLCAQSLVVGSNERVN